jgi:hypothetical protein
LPEAASGDALEKKLGDWLDSTRVYSGIDTEIQFKKLCRQLFARFNLQIAINGRRFNLLKPSGLLDEIEAQDKEMAAVFADRPAFRRTFISPHQSTGTPKPAFLLSNFGHQACKEEHFG